MKNKKEPNNRKEGGAGGGSSLSFSERLCKALDIQPDILPNGTLIELRGRSSVTLRGCGSVLCYTDTQVSFCSRFGKVCVSGHGLCCSSYKRGTATVEGVIEGVFFEREGK